VTPIFYLTPIFYRGPNCHDNRANRFVQSTAPVRMARLFRGLVRVEADVYRLRSVTLFGEMRIPKDSLLGGHSLKGGWSNGIRRTWDRNGRAFGGAGAWARRGLARSYCGQMSGRMGEHHYGTERKESAEEKAERIVIEELRGLGAVELGQRAKGDPVKIAVAVRLRGETTMTLKWISGRLQMGAWTHLKQAAL
jgi:hypothetical protein